LDDLLRISSGKLGNSEMGHERASLSTFGSFESKENRDHASIVWEEVYKHCLTKLFQFSKNDNSRSFQ
jgi:hypothetical protein